MQLKLLNVRLVTELHTKAKIKSKEKNITINEFIKQAVETYIRYNYNCINLEKSVNNRNKEIFTEVFL